MRLTPVVLLAALSAVLAGIVATELVDVAGPPQAAAAQAEVAAGPVRSAGPVDAAQDGQIATLLARPPFAPDRRPDPGQAAADPSLPHLTGILINGPDRRAIFAMPEAGRPEGRNAVVHEGDPVGAYRVQTIGPAAVMLAGPAGVQAVQPRFSSAPLAAPDLPRYTVPATQAGLARLPIPTAITAPAALAPPSLGSPQ